MTGRNQGIDQQAAEWAVRLHGRTLTAEERQELDQWVGADPRNRGALLRAQAVWVDLDRLAALAVGKKKLTERSLPRSPQATPSSRPTRRWFIAASLVLAMVTGGSAWWATWHRNVYVSIVGQVRRVALSDGSSMVLNTATEATVNFDSTRREIELATGEGLFQVAKDPKRPFVVHAGSISVRAVGTVFSVRTTDKRVDVTVTEGTVELVDNSGGSGSVMRRVSANEHATVMEARQVEVNAIPHDEAERRLAWRDGMVDFDGESLSAAVDEINRHNHRHIVVDDPTLAGRPVVGLFRANDPDGFAATVSRALGAQSVDGKDAIHLRSGSTP